MQCGDYGIIHIRGCKYLDIADTQVPKGEDMWTERYLTVFCLDKCVSDQGSTVCEKVFLNSSS